MDNQKRITIKELSKHIGVSATTITNALTGQPNVSDEKRKLIIKKAKELGYKPNRYARAMVRNGLTIGLVMPEEPNEYLHYYRKGVRHELEELSDFKLVGKFFPYSDTTANHEVMGAMEAALKEDLDGLVFGQSFYVDSYYGKLKEAVESRKLPVCFINHPVRDVPYVSCISADAKVIGELAAEFLAAVYPANTHVGVITTYKNYTIHTNIVDSFTECCGREGLHLSAVMEGNDDKTKTYECTYAMLKNDPEIKVIYVTSFNHIPVCRCIKSLGLENKVKVIGQDVYPEMKPYLMSGQLIATIFQNPFLQGRLAVRSLFNHIAGDKTYDEKIEIRPELVLRSNLRCYEKDDFYL